MEKIQEYLKNPLLVGIVALVVGLLIGLFVLGYGLFPLEWTDAAPDKLHSDYQDVYFCMAAEAYFKTGDAAQTKTRFEYLGEVSQEKLSSMLPGDCGLDLGEIEQLKVALSAVGLEPGDVTVPAGEEPVATDDEGGAGLNPVLLIGGLCLVTLVIGGALAYILIFRNRGKSASNASPSPAYQAQMMNQEAEHTDFAADGQDPPIVQYMSTYVSGDDLYDDSFSIASPSG